MWSLPAWRQEREEMLERVSIPLHTQTHHSYTDPLLSISHSSFSTPLLTHIVDIAHTHIHANRAELFLICTKCRLSQRCSKSGLSSMSEVWGSIIYPFSPLPSGSTSPAGDTHLLYGILLSLLPAVTMASAIKRSSSDCQYLTPPSHTARHNPYWFSFLICFECGERHRHTMKCFIHIVTRNALLMGILWCKPQHIFVAPCHIHLHWLHILAA